MRRLQGAIFDLDGVLLNTEPYQWKGWAEVLRPYGISLSKQEYLSYAGKGGDHIEAELIRRHELDVGRGILLRKKQHLLLRWFSTMHITSIPSARGAVELFLAKHIPVAVASGGSRQEVELKLKRTQFAEFFQVIVTSSDVRRGKPFPDIYLRAAELLGIEPRDAIAFEDTQYGVAAATAAGITCYALPGELTRGQDFSSAERTFKNFREALPWLRERYKL